MADASGLAAMISSFTPGGALLFGLCSGSLIFLISKLVLRSGLLAGREVRSLHLELGAVASIEQVARDSAAVAGDSPGEVQALRQQATLRWWRTDEVVIDEGMGFN